MFESINEQLYVYQTKKFKTITVTAYLMVPFEYKMITHASLVARIMKVGTNAYPNHQLFNQHLESLYGLTCQTGAYHIGKMQLIELTTTSINERYIKEPFDLFSKQLSLMHDMLFDLKTNHEAFDTVNLNLVKKQLADHITNVLNDKRTFAIDRYHTFIDDKGLYGSRNMGYLDQLEAVNEESLYDYYQQFIKQMKMVVFVTGDLNDEQLSLLENTFKHTSNDLDVEFVVEFNAPEFTSHVEEIEVNQSHLVYGFKLGANRLNDHAIGLVYNQILGGYMQSKLFKIVREKHSLCYTVYSSYQPTFGTMIVYAGIQREKEKQAKLLIEEQLHAMRTGDVTDQELKDAKAQLVSALKKNQDSASSLISQNFNQLMVKNSLTLDQLEEHIMNVSVEDLVRVANTVEAMMYYFLAGKEGHDE